MRNRLGPTYLTSAFCVGSLMLAAALWSPMSSAPYVADAQASELRKITGTFQGKGVQCPIMRDRSGNVHSLTTIPKGVKVGDRILVIGRNMLFGTCMQGGLIAVEEVRKLGSDGSVLKVWKIGKG